MAKTGFNLPDIVRCIRKYRVLIVVITLLSGITGAVLYMAGPKKYEARTEFVLRNPLYGDRNNLYNYDTKFIDYFANEEDLDRLILMSEAPIVQSKVIKNLDLATAYGIDPSTRKGEQQLERKFSKSFNITRTEYKDLVLTYVDVVPERAARVANECVRVLEQTFGDYYKDMRRGMYESIMEKIHDEDSMISSMTDSLARMRDRYGIYEIISPARYNLMLGGMKASGKKDYAMGLELVQNLESLKDEIVTDRAKQVTIVNQFKTGMRAGQLPMIKVVAEAKEPVSPKGIGGSYTVLASSFLGFFFCTLLLLLVENMGDPENGK